MKDLKEEIKRIKADRSIVRVVGMCDLCRDDDVSILEDVLRLNFISKDGEESEIVLCNLHEGILIQRLLKPLLKRLGCSPKARDRKMGFKGDIPKDFPGEEEDGAIPSALERLSHGDKLAQAQSFLME